MSDDPNPLFTIGELARRTGLSVRTIRFWSDEGVVPPTERTPAGYRLYDAEALARLELVRTLRELDLDLPTVRRVLAEQATLGEVAAAHVRALDAEIRTLRTRRAILATVAHRKSNAEEMRLMHKMAQLSAAERQRLVDGFVERTFAGLPEDAPGARIAQGMRTLPAELPDDPSKEQVDAWIELTELIADEEFALRVRQMAVAGANGGEPPSSFESEAMVARVERAVADGIEPESAAARAVVDEVLTEELSAAERVRLGDDLALFTSRKVERYWALLGVLNGWPAMPPKVPAYEWFIAALRAS